MPLNINKKYQYIEYLGETRPITQLSSRNNIAAIIGISNDGMGYVTWEFDSTINSLLTLRQFSGYLIVSKDNQPNYALYTEQDAVPTSQTAFNIDKTLTIARYKSTADKLIDNLLIKTNFRQIFGISEDGLNPISWSDDSSLNSLDALVNNVSYLVVAKNVPFNFWSDLPPTPTPTNTPTPTPTITPGLPPSSTPTNTPTNTPTPSITATRTPTPTSTPLPPDFDFSIVFDKPVYYFDKESNHIDEQNLVSATIIGQPNIPYSYTFSSESNNSVLVFDNPTGIMALDHNNDMSVGKIFTNVKINNTYGQSIIKCSITDQSNKTLDALCVVLVNPPMGEPTPSVTPTLTPTPTQTLTPTPIKN